MSVSAKVKWVLSKALYKVALVAEWEIKRNATTDTGEHRQSITAYSNWLEAWVRSNVRQALISEFGRQPWKAPPFDALVWRVIRHFGLPGRKTGKYDAQPFETKRAIRAVALKIARVGIKGQQLYSWTVEKNKSKLNSTFVKAINEYSSKS